MTEGPEYRVIEATDERDPLARSALELLVTAIGDVQPVDDLLSELEERRRGLPTGSVYHLLVLVDREGQPAGAAAGVYLRWVNAGFITYLGVRRGLRGRALGRGIRERLVQCFRDDARQAHGTEPAWVVGEVHHESPWLRALVRRGKAIPFGFSYFHPWMPMRSEGRYVLYREPIGDARPELPADEVERLVYAIWRRAYRVRFPLQSETFRYMMQQIEEAGSVAADPGFPEPEAAPQPRA